MQTAIKKWGNSLAIRIPSSISKTLNLKEENIIDINLKDNQIILEKKLDLISLCQNIDESNLNIDSQWEGKEWQRSNPKRSSQKLGL